MAIVIPEFAVAKVTAKLTSEQIKDLSTHLQDSNIDYSIEQSRCVENSTESQGYV